jgi:hypothetical protein
VDLDGGEPELLDSEGLRCEGHDVAMEPNPDGSVRLLIHRHGG